MHLMVYTGAGPTGISKADDVNRCHALKGQRSGTLLRHAWVRLGQSVHWFVMRDTRQLDGMCVTAVVVTKAVILSVS